MVQVDVFWSYAIGAGFASAASRQFMNPAQNPQGTVPNGNDSLLGNKYFSAAVIYLAAFFAPSGIGLLWAFPSWETMHAGNHDLPTWLVMLFSITNVTQGILGFWVTKKLFQAGQAYLASLQLVIGYFCMFFILVHGWDGTGYQRFFSANRDIYLSWHFSDLFRFLVSDVALTLYGMGIILIPVMLYLMSNWILRGADNPSNSSRFDIALKIGKVILIGALGLAIAASLLIHLLGWIIGWLVFVPAAYYFAFRRGRFLPAWLADMLAWKKDALK